MKPSLHLPRRMPSQRWLWLIGGLMIVLALIAGTLLTYRWSLAARDPQSTRQVRFVISRGESLDDIARNLQSAELIREPLAIRIYAELSGVKNRLQAGTYVLTAAQSVPEIMDRLSTGRTDEFDVRILPGKTLTELTDDLVRDGFARVDVQAALAQSYDHPLLAGKPAAQSLEGYIYPDTYRVNVAASPAEVLRKSFDAFYAKLQADKVQESLSARGLSLNQGIILASIVQKEVGRASVQPQVAQVFLKRLSINMMLGSDVTYMYAAKQLGVEPSVNLDSPYNTRRYPGLPPGPIANFNYSALQAVMNPAAGDYLYFVAGDDGTTHFARTVEEHEANVARYCTVLCR